MFKLHPCPVNNGLLDGSFGLSKFQLLPLCSSDKTHLTNFSELEDIGTEKLPWTALDSIKDLLEQIATIIAALDHS